MFEFCFCREEILSLFRTSLSPWRLRSQVQCIDLAYFQPYSPLLLQFSVVIHQKSFLICCRLLIRNLLFTWLNLPSRRCHVYSKTTRLPRTPKLINLQVAWIISFYLSIYRPSQESYIRNANVGTWPIKANITLHPSPNTNIRPTRVRLVYQQQTRAYYISADYYQLAIELIESCKQNTKLCKQLKTFLLPNFVKYHPACMNISGSLHRGLRKTMWSGNDTNFENRVINFWSLQTWMVNAS